MGAFAMKQPESVEYSRHNKRTKLRAEMAAASATTAKAHEERLATRLQNIRWIVVTGGTVYGALAVLAYTYSEGIGFVGGLSVGDALFFGFVALVLGVIGVALAAMGATALLPIWGLRSQRRLLTQFRELWERMAWTSAIARLTAVAAKCLPPRLTQLCRSFLWPQHPAFLLMLLTLPETLVLLGRLLAHWSSGSSALIAQVAPAGLIGAWVLSILASSSLVARTKAPDSALESVLLGITSGSVHLFFAALLISDSGWALVLGCVLGGAAVTAAIALLDAPTTLKPERSSTRLLFFAGFFFFGMVMPILATALEQTGSLRRDVYRIVFGGLGVRSEGVMVRLSPIAAETIRSTSLLQGTPATLCRLPGIGYLMSDALVLWHGIGSRTHISWPAGPASANPIRTDVPSSDVGIFRGPRLRCVDVPDLAFFDSGRTERLNEPEKEIIVNAVMSHICNANRAGQKLLSLQVIGNADPMPTLGGNDRLARERALRVKSVLQDSPALLSVLTTLKITPVEGSNGSRDLIRECSSREAPEFQRECNSVNRRVEIRLKFGDSEPKSSIPSVELSCKAHQGS